MTTGTPTGGRVVLPRPPRRVALLLLPGLPPRPGAPGAPSWGLMGRAPTLRPRSLPPPARRAGPGRPRPLGELGQVVLTDRATLPGPANPDDHLLPGERLGHPAALDHREGGLLHRGQPAAAVLAGPPTPDHQAVVDLPGVDDPGVRTPAVRTPHDDSLPRELAWMRAAWILPDVGDWARRRG